MLRPCQPTDAAAICAIYNHYVRDTVITFEEVPVREKDMRQRIIDTTAAYPWLVFEEAGAVLGYAYATAWRARSAYRFSVESTVYLAPDAGGRGLGFQLYAALLDALRAGPFHVVVGGIALPNAASVALHQKLGFTKVAELHEVGFKFNRWIDVGYWELQLAQTG